MNPKIQKNLLKIVKNNYNKIAQEFSQTRSNCFWPELTNLAKQVKDGDNILDVGCGNGRLLKLFANKKINYLGIDNSKKLINLAKINKQSSINNAQFIIGDILKLDKINQTNFDYIFCIAVLHHIPGHDLQIDALKQLKKKLKPNGKIIITVWNLWTQKKYYKLIWRFSILKLLNKNKMDFGDILFDWKNNQGNALSQRYYHAFTAKKLKKIAQKAELKIKKIYKDKYIFYSLGNFVFDQMWSQETREGLAVKLTLTKQGVKNVEYFPVVSENYSQPRHANEKEAEKILEYLGKVN